MGLEDNKKNQNNNGKKKVGFLLFIGIFFMPYIFSWFTLKKGRSTLSKVLSFGWMAIFILSMAFAPPEPPKTAAGLEKLEQEKKEEEKKKWGREQKKYSSELTNAQIVCNSVIPQKFGDILSEAKPRKNILLGYKDGTIGQIGYKGSGKRVPASLSKDVRFRWTWSLPNGRFIKCLILDNGTYKISIEKL